MSNLATLDCEIAQEDFLKRGGAMQRALSHKIKTGEIAQYYSFNEYPKAIKINHRTEAVDCTTETCRGTLIHWTENRKIWDEIIVSSEEEEERVLSGGATSAQIEEQRHALYQRCLSQGIQADRSWSMVRLKRELGEKLDEAPKDDIGAARARLAELEELASLRAQIAFLEAQSASPAAVAPVDEEVAVLRASLVSLGIKPDARWGEKRLREELDRASAE